MFSVSDYDLNLSHGQGLGCNSEAIKKKSNINQNYLKEVASCKLVPLDYSMLHCVNSVFFVDLVLSDTREHNIPFPQHKLFSSFVKNYISKSQLSFKRY